MNPRLEKLRQEREKLAEKLASLTARLKALDEQILKLENTDIVGIVRENGLTIEQLAALMAMLEKSVPRRRCPTNTEKRRILWMKNKWRFFAVTLAVVLCMTVFSVTAYAGGDMVDSTMGDPTMETPTATTQPENTNTGEQTPNGQTLTVLVTENADGSHTVTIGDRSSTLPAKREQSGKVVNVRTYLNLRTGPGTDYTVIGRLLNGAEVKVLEKATAGTRWSFRSRQAMYTANTLTS